MPCFWLSSSYADQDFIEPTALKKSVACQGWDAEREFNERCSMNLNIDVGRLECSACNLWVQSLPVEQTFSPLMRLINVALLLLRGCWVFCHLLPFSFSLRSVAALWRRIQSLLKSFQTMLHAELTTLAIATKCLPIKSTTCKQSWRWQSRCEVFRGLDLWSSVRIQAATPSLP
jgi:hypothetical protein